MCLSSEKIKNNQSNKHCLISLSYISGSHVVECKIILTLPFSSCYMGARLGQCFGCKLLTKIYFLRETSFLQNLSKIVMEIFLFTEAI